VEDIARRISGIIARQEGAGLHTNLETGASDPMKDDSLSSPDDEASLKRITFNYVPVESSVSVSVELNAGDTVLFLSPDRDDEIAGRSQDILRLEYGVETLPLRYFKGTAGQGEECCDLLTDEGSGRAAATIAGLASLAGLVITLPQDGTGRVGGVTDVARLLRGLFLPLKTFLRSPAKKFVVLVHSGEVTETYSRLLADGLLGQFLCAAQEYPTVQFRTVAIESDTDLRAALRGALDRGCPVVEFVHRDGRVLTSEGQSAPSVFIDSSGTKLSPGDVVVMSGGATGISAHLARSLAPFLPRLVFLGRTSPDSGDDRAAEIARTLADLHSSGIEATYHTCDVTDPVAVRTIMGEVVNRYGRVDGIIHGAGVLRDGFLTDMTPDDFSLVTDIKFLGAWNLFSAAEDAGLKFFVGLSSAAAIQGNPGQANYAAANRMMSALLRALGLKNGEILVKALMLPPVEGAGMAENPEVRKILKRMGVAYIHADELAGLFCRELFVAPACDDWVMFMRRLPALKTALVKDSIHPSLRGDLAGGTVTLSPEDVPMIDRISSLDIRRGELEAIRTFSLENDLWIADHRPFTFLAHPLVSAAMVLETFMESARILYPHLQVRGVRRVRLLEMIQCPPGVPRIARITCRRSGNNLREVLCEVTLSLQEISPSGRLTDRFTPHCTGMVILAGGEGSLGEELPGFPVRPDEFRTGPMDHNQVLQWYNDRSGLDGRYRVMESLDGAGPGVVRGRTIYRETDDFAHLQNARYQYSPYLFEALLQLVGFQIAATDPSERRSMIPLEIGEMRFVRQCRAGEQLTLEARMRSEDDDGLAWDARGVDDEGRTIMQANIRMHWVKD
jgi:NAD(P)-dependent dehydrogenase (short-subunit alcohol dehydrogenase family)